MQRAIDPSPAVLEAHSGVRTPLALPRNNPSGTAMREGARVRFRARGTQRSPPERQPSRGQH
jgi:hypothetical protein